MANNKKQVRIPLLKKEFQANLTGKKSQANKSNQIQACEETQENSCPNRQCFNRVDLDRINIIFQKLEEAALSSSDSNTSKEIHQHVHELRNIFNCESFCRNERDARCYTSIKDLGTFTEIVHANASSLSVADVKANRQIQSPFEVNSNSGLGIVADNDCETKCSEDNVGTVDDWSDHDSDREMNGGVLHWESVDDVIFMQLNSTPRNTNRLSSVTVQSDLAATVVKTYCSPIKKGKCLTSSNRTWKSTPINSKNEVTPFASKARTRSTRRDESVTKICVSKLEIVVCACTQ